jgi:hypothetical protein
LAKATTCITPSVFASAFIISSSMFRDTLQSALTAECDAMIGAFDSSAAFSIEPFDGCDTSTIMPSRFISAITRSPSGEMPFFQV